MTTKPRQSRGVAVKKKRLNKNNQRTDNYCKEGNTFD
jgi:hypothetical protein